MKELKNDKQTNKIYQILYQIFGEIEMQKDELGVFYSKFIVLNKNDLIKATLEIMEVKWIN